MEERVSLRSAIGRSESFENGFAFAEEAGSVVIGTCVCWRCRYTYKGWEISLLTVGLSWLPVAGSSTIDMRGITIGLKKCDSDRHKISSVWRMETLITLLSSAITNKNTFD